jgi:hypothetical protein
VRGQKTPRIGAADPINATKYTVCHHGADGKIEYWQGVPKAQEIGRTSSYTHKEQVRRLSRAFGSIIEAVVASFLRFFFPLIVVPDIVRDGSNLLFSS